MTARETLIKRIKEQGPIGYGYPGPVVSLEEFFAENEDYGSIGCNLTDHPGPRAFFKLLRAIRERSDVQGVLVEIYEVEETDESMWPFSERVYIMTTAGAREVKNWLLPLQPDEVSEGWLQGKPPAAADLRPGFHVFGAWWD
jgi:hypothetical protein